MRSRLLLGVLVPVALLLGLNTWSLYGQALRAADTAYDRTLLASAKAIGELLEVGGPREAPTLRANVPYSALEAFEADNRSRMYFKVTGFAGEMVSGFDDLPAWRGRLPTRSVYAALVDFYDDEYRGQRVRVAVLLQPVAGETGQGMATIQVAETLELRQTLAQQMLWSTLWRQLLLLAVVSAVVVWVVHRATAPIRRLSTAIDARAADDLSPIDARLAPRELRPLIDATNAVMGRLDGLLARQKRFVRDASHQLRTPLAVLKTQVQSALRGDHAPLAALHEIGATVDDATRLANQMLALAKIEQAGHDQPLERLNLSDLAGAVALDIAPLIAEKCLDFELADGAPVWVRAQDWMLREVTRNLLHNAIRACPIGGALTVAVRVEADGRACLSVRDSGRGLDPAVREHLFEPFHTGQSRGGSGLGLHICREIAQRLGGEVRLVDRPAAAGQDHPDGVDAQLWLPAAAGSESGP
jgi:two-component system sensor histidine kinase TctE